MRSWFSSIQIEQPVEQPVQTPRCRRMNQTRCLYRKSLSHSAPTGQRSTTLPESLLCKRKAGHHVDFLVGAAAGDHQLVGAADFRRKTHAAAAHHAAIDKQRHVAQVAPAAGEGRRSARRSAWPYWK